MSIFCIGNPIVNLMDFEDFEEFSSFFSRIILHIVFFFRWSFSTINVMYFFTWRLSATWGRCGSGDWLNDALSGSREF